MLYMTMTPLQSLKGGGSQARDILVELEDVTLTCVGPAVGAVWVEISEVTTMNIINIRGVPAGRVWTVSTAEYGPVPPSVYAATLHS